MDFCGIVCWREGKAGNGEQRNLLELRLGPISGTGAGGAKARAGDKCRDSEVSEGIKSVHLGSRWPALRGKKIYLHT